MSPPQKVIEYMSAGKPVIANRIQTHSMLITDEYNGYLTEYNPLVISERILYLKENPDVYKIMSKNALRTSRKFDTSIVYREMATVIDEVLNHKPNLTH
jgi:glycosyltransferase involved in cell wall biosynthesis